MWFLKSLNSDAIYYIRPELAKHTVSRSVGDLIIRDDPSISRNHAFLYPEQAALKVIDAGSRYGTFINDAIDSSREQITKDVPTELKLGDRIRFGKCQSMWNVCRVDFNCITSTISVSGTLQDALRKLGGRVDDICQPKITRFLIMKTITTTTKLLMCLIEQIPVVRPEYFEECVKAVENNVRLPNVDDFIPEFTESYVRSDGIDFKAVPARKTLFKDKVFIFLKAKHMSQYEKIITSAGGSCICAQKRKIAKSFFAEPHVIVMQNMTDSCSQGSSQAIQGLQQLVTDAGRRMIPEADIGLAILYCSLEKYCNPLYKFSNLLDLETVRFTQGATLAKNSEELSKEVCSKQNVSIPETESRDSSESFDVHGSSSVNSMALKASEIVSEFTKPAAAATNAVRGKRKREETTDEKRPAEERKRHGKKVEIDRVSVAAESPELVIPETPPEQQPPSQLSQMSGFLSVNHDEPMSPAKAAPNNQPKKRLLNLDDNDDDLFNFGDSHVPKRAKRQTSLADSFSASQSQKRTRSNDREGDGDLFSFKASRSKRAKNSSSTEPAVSSENLSIDPKNATTSNSATSSSYKQFIKPIKIPVDNWLSSNFCELSVKTPIDGSNMPNGSEEQNSEKIKVDPDDVDDKTRVWFDGMEAMFQVRVKCMNLTSRRPAADSILSSENSYSGSSANRGFKAFVKTRFRLFSSRNTTTKRSKR
ncbi:nibrin isoform X2 [Sabethes cyaneus]|uniref:nibrin isoform X2 n=1 Tax=Sabethes cyaneus TaxID=53552 RepID=UPI00237DC90E|nr:nibrin isoform X2 [Sabethes cyaneus]